MMGNFRQSPLHQKLKSKGTLGGLHHLQIYLHLTWDHICHTYTSFCCGKYSKKIQGHCFWYVVEWCQRAAANHTSPINFQVCGGECLLFALCTFTTQHWLPVTHLNAVSSADFRNSEHNTKKPWALKAEEHLNLLETLFVFRKVWLAQLKHQTNIIFLFYQKRLNIIHVCVQHESLKILKNKHYLPAPLRSVWTLKDEMFYASVHRPLSLCHSQS